MVYELNYNLVFHAVFLKEQIYLGKMVLKLFTTFIVVIAILASPKCKAFGWVYRSNIYRVHWSYYVNSNCIIIIYFF